MTPLTRRQALMIPIGLIAFFVVGGFVSSVLYPNESHYSSTASSSQDATDNEPPKQWYAIVADHSECFATVSPADAVRALRSAGQSPQISDATDGAAKVEFEGGIKTFYRSKEACDSALQGMNYIPDKYEAASNADSTNSAN